MIQYLDDGELACFDGYSFRLDKKTGYYLSSKKIGSRRKRLHVYVWEKVNGAVPKGFHVHHADGNKNNNEPENLILISSSEHARHHGDTQTDAAIERKRRNLMQNAVPMSKAWHSSDEGKQWHSEHAKETQAKMKESTYICSYCGVEYRTTKKYNEAQNTFCSNKCRAAYRRKMGYDDITKICESCGGEYTANKYQKTKYCPLCRDKKHRA